MSKKRTKRKTEFQRYESIFAKLKPIESYGNVDWFKKSVVRVREI